MPESRDELRTDLSLIRDPVEARVVCGRAAAANSAGTFGNASVSRSTPTPSFVVSPTPSISDFLPKIIPGQCQITVHGVREVWRSDLNHNGPLSREYVFTMAALEFTINGPPPRDSHSRLPVKPTARVQ